MILTMEECSDTEETVWQKPTEILEDLSAFLVNKCGDKRPRKQPIRISPEQFHRSIVVESEKSFEALLRKVVTHTMMGDGAKMARGRRQWGRLEEMRAKNEREAAWRAATTGREVVRRGQFWLG